VPNYQLHNYRISNERAAAAELPCRFPAELSIFGLGRHQAYDLMGFFGKGEAEE
jgi:hypothetical protein